MNKIDIRHNFLDIGCTSFSPITVCFQCEYGLAVHARFLNLPAENRPSTNSNTLHPLFAATRQITSSLEKEFSERARFPGVNLKCLNVE